MSDPPWQWRNPTEEELGDFQGHCWPTESTVLFPWDTLSPSDYAVQLYQEAGKTRMADIDDEYAASVYSDYVTQEQEEGGVGSPRKKARSVKNNLTDLRISESLIRPMPNRPALLKKVIMTLPEPLQKAMNPSTPSLDSKSIATLPNPPFNSDALCTPTRHQTPNDPYLTATPYSRAHKTGRKYLCARCIDVRLLCCWISFNIHLLQAAHLVPCSLGQLKYHQLLEYLRRAVGGRFSVNSRVNYLLLHQPIHTSFDNQGAIVYPIQPYVLDAVEEYLNWLDLKDGGKPWVNQQVPVDYFKCLRSEHPLLSDGHMYAIRFTSLKAEKAVDILVYRRYTQLGQKAELDTVATEPYAELPTRKVFTNPILLLLNLIHQFEKTFTSESMRDRNAWSRTREEWKNWIELSPKLKHLVGQDDLDTLTNKSHPSVEGLAHALAVAGHLRRRLPLEFQWVIEKPDDDSDVFSDPSTSCTPSQHCTSADRGGPGSKEDRLGGGGSGSGHGIFDIQTGKKKRKQAEEQTDCTNIVKEWQKQNSKPQSFLCKLRLSNGPKRNEGSKIGPQADQSAWVSQSGIRSAGFRKIFGIIANRTS